MTDIDYLVKQATSPEFQLWKPYCDIVNAYQGFNNDNRKKPREENLRALNAAANEMANKIGALLATKQIATYLCRNISHKTRDNLPNHYLNMTQLYQHMMHTDKSDIKIQYMTALYHHLKDLAAIAEVTESDPNPLLSD